LARRGLAEGVILLSRPFTAAPGEQPTLLISIPYVHEKQGIRSFPARAAYFLLG
jgi:hypothetical protein